MARTAARNAWATSTTATWIGSTLVPSEVASGYDGGQDPTLPQGNFCHGGPFDNSPGSGGSNKDTPIEAISPYSAQDHAAADLAEPAPPPPPSPTSFVQT